MALTSNALATSWRTRHQRKLSVNQVETGFFCGSRQDSIVHIFSFCPVVFSARTTFLSQLGLKLTLSHTPLLVWKRGKGKMRVVPPTLLLKGVKKRMKLKGKARKFSLMRAKRIVSSLSLSLSSLPTLTLTHLPHFLHFPFLHPSLFEDKH